MPATASTSCGSRCWRPRAFDMAQTDLDRRGDRTTTPTSRCSPTASAPGSARGAMLQPVLVESHLPERARRHHALRRTPRGTAVAAARPMDAARRCDRRPAGAADPAVSRRPSRSRCRRPKCRKGRRCISAGGARSTASRAPKGPSASRRNGGARRQRRRIDPRLFPHRGCRRPPLLALPPRPLRRRASAAALVHARGLRMNALTVTALCRVRHPVEFLLPARRLEAGGTGRRRLACSAHAGDRPCRPQHGGRRGARLEPVRRTGREASFAYHPGCRLVFGDGTPDILAYPQDRKGWGHLCRLLTQANLRDETEKGATLLQRERSSRMGGSAVAGGPARSGGGRAGQPRLAAPAQGPFRQGPAACRRARLCAATTASASSRRRRWPQAPACR